MKIAKENMNTNRKLQFVTSASAALLLTFTALAQEKPDLKPERTEYTHQHAAPLRADRLAGAIRAGDVIGMTVKNYQNEKLGTVERLYLDVESGRIAQVILSSGGFLSVGGTLAVVPPEALRLDPANKMFFLDVSKEKFAGAPKMQASDWKTANQPRRLAEAYAYYGVPTYFAADRDGFRISNPEKNHTVNFAGSSSEALAGENYLNERGAMTSRPSLGDIQRARKLLGKPVTNLQQQRLGRVDNFVVDVSAGRIVAVIISSGGFMGFGYELSAVPPSALRFNAARNAFQLDASKEVFASSPHFKSNAWPDFRESDYVGGVYRAYEVNPYFATDTTPDIDNSREYVRDRDSRTLTPLNQGSAAADQKTTIQIRQGILADSGLSKNARNVKIVTLDGQVTLRGLVNTAEEKRLVGKIANWIATAGNVDNQLEVQPATDRD